MTCSITGVASSKIRILGSVKSSLLNGIAHIYYNMGAYSVCGTYWNPSNLFNIGDVGWFFDPSDINKLFQDSAGTIPVTSAGQPVGLIIDKSGNGNHARQPTSLNRPIIGRHPFGGRYNLLLQTENLPASPWAGNSTSVMGGDGFSIVSSSTAAWSSRYQDLGSLSGDFTARVTFRAGTESSVMFGLLATTGIWPAKSLVSCQVLSGPGTFVPSPGTANGWIEGSGLSQDNETTVELYVTGWSPTAGVRMAFYPYGSGSGPVTGNPNRNVLISKVQVLNSATPRPYQKVTTQYDVTEYGVPDCWYLSFNGTNQWMQTGSFSLVSDEVSISVGVRKLRDTSAGLVYEFSPDLNTNNGAFYLVYPRSGTINEPINSSRGTVAALAANNSNIFIAPISNVITTISSITPPLNQQRVNGSLRVSSVGTQGTGNYGNYPLYIGARGGTTIFFSGNIYSSFGINRILTAYDLQLLEKWTAIKTGISI